MLITKGSEFKVWLWITCVTTIHFHLMQNEWDIWLRVVERCPAPAVQSSEIFRGTGTCRHTRRLNRGCVWWTGRPLERNCLQKLCANPATGGRALSRRKVTLCWRTEGARIGSGFLSRCQAAFRRPPRIWCCVISPWHISPKTTTLLYMLPTTCMKEVKSGFICADEYLFNVHNSIEFVHKPASLRWVDCLCRDSPVAQT